MKIIKESFFTVRTAVRLLSLIFLSRTGTAQSLLSNGDFEQYLACPFLTAQLDTATDWMSPTTNIFFVSGTPDYFNGCAGFGQVAVPQNNFGSQPARSGQGYAGIDLMSTTYVNFREYIETGINPPLQAGNCYRFEMYLSRADKGRMACDGIGVYFSDTLISGINNALPLPITPQLSNPPGNFITDTLNWILFTGNYIAHGGEQYLVIGNFKNDSATTSMVADSTKLSSDVYVYIDDVSLVQIPSCNTGLTGSQENLYKMVYPNPFDGSLTVETTREPYDFCLTDMTGRIFFHEKIADQKTLDTHTFQPGVYFYQWSLRGVPAGRGRLVKQ